MTTEVYKIVIRLKPAAIKNRLVDHIPEERREAFEEALYAINPIRGEVLDVTYCPNCGAWDITFIDLDRKNTEVYQYLVQGVYDQYAKLM
jgi:hypothetical protein